MTEHAHTIPALEAEILDAEEGEQDAIFNAEDNQILRSNRDLRRKMIALIMPEDKLPAEKEKLSALMSLMKDLDNEVLTRARIKVAVKSEENATNLNAMVCKALLQHKVGANGPAAASQRVLPSHLQITDIVPGEMDIGVIGVTMEELRDD